MMRWAGWAEETGLISAVADIDQYEVTVAYRLQ